MSYPPQRYLGDAGEISAVFRPFDTEPNVVSPGGSNSYLATHALTKGEFGLDWVSLGAPRAAQAAVTQPPARESRPDEAEVAAPLGLGVGELSQQGLGDPRAPRARACSSS
jgi:hypothetical protein